MALWQHCQNKKVHLKNKIHKFGNFPLYQQLGMSVPFAENAT